MSAINILTRSMMECKCKTAKSLAERIIDNKEFVSLVKRMREAQEIANRAMVEVDDYSEALIHVNKANELEKEVDECLKRMEE